jgi:hypothetical protein
MEILGESTILLERSWKHGGKPMGPAQKLILLIGLIIIGLMWVYPPWIYTYGGHTFSFSHEAGYFLFFKRPMP